MNIIRNKYDKTISRIQFKTAKAEFDVELRGFITALTGVSSSGKSFFLESLYNYFLNNGMELKEKYKLQGVLLLNSTSVSFALTDNEVINNLKNKKGWLILIDNADTIFMERNKVVEYISRDVTNQYIIATRGGIGLPISTNHYSDLHYDSNRITNKFLTSIQGWK